MPLPTHWKLSFSATTLTQSALRVLASVLILTCTQSASADLLDAYKSSDAPLAGKIWDLRSNTFTTPDELLKQLEPNSWLILGETHENLDHHRIQTEIIDTLAEQGRMGSLALEMANSEQQVLLDQAHAGDLEITPKTLQWQRGWPWEWYEAPVKKGLERASRVVAADLTRAAKMDAYRDEALEVPAKPAYQEFMLELLFQSHCEQMPKSQLGSMLRVQYARDLNMLEAMQNNTNPEAVNILLAGTVHTRYDIGIPYWSEDLKSTTVLMIAADTNPDPMAYYPDTYSDQPIADYLLFTPPTEYESGCN